ncbi:MAG: OadG family protein [Bacteroidales bacterium]|nr:OadG family protein [Bacteroidales bacterium]
MQSENLAIFIVGYVVVFAALVLLYYVFFYLAKLQKLQLKRDMVKKGKISSTAEEVDFVPEEVNVAIALALHMHFNEAHDAESYISTIRKVSRTYSPWSSKIYNVRNSFNRA